MDYDLFEKDKNSSSFLMNAFIFQKEIERFEKTEWSTQKPLVFPKFWVFLKGLCDKVWI